MFAIRSLIAREGDMGITVLIEGLEEELRSNFILMVSQIFVAAALLCIPTFVVTGPSFRARFGENAASISLIAVAAVGIIIVSLIWEIYLAQCCYNAFWGHYYPYLIFHGLPVPSLG